MLLLNPIMSYVKMSLVLLFLLTASAVVTYAQCPSVRQIDFKNRTYPLRESGFTKGNKRLHVNNGHYDEHDNPEATLAFLYFEIKDVVYGDLTGDGREEAAVVTNYGSNSGNFYLTDTYIFGCSAGKVKLIGILKESRIENDSGLLMHESVKRPVRIRNGILYVTHRTGGSHPSPDFVTTFRYKIVHGKLVSRGRPINRKVDK